MNQQAYTFTLEEPRGLVVCEDVDVTDCWYDSDMFAEDGEEVATAFIDKRDDCAQFVAMRVQDASVGLTYWMNRDQTIRAMGERFVTMTEYEHGRDAGDGEHRLTFADVM